MLVKSPDSFREFYDKSKIKMHVSTIKVNILQIDIKAYFNKTAGSFNTFYQIFSPSSNIVN